MIHNRLIYFKLFIIIVVLTIIIKLFYIQVVNEKYKILSNYNSVRNEMLYPSRGEILDRNGLLLAQSKEAYDLYVMPINLKTFDTVSLSSALQITKFQLDSILDNCKKYSNRKASILKEGINQITKLKIQELNINGLTSKYRSIRSYPYLVAGNILGYIGNVSRKNIINDEFYNIHDYIGKAGLEHVYEKYLRGEKGLTQNVVNVHGAVVGSYKNGMDDYPSVNGNNITTTIDLNLQKFGEELMKDKIGAIVAIEPATGEILAMISSPTYNPDLLIGNQRTKNYKILAKDKRMPLYNRSTSGAYPPGSIFKLAAALVSLQDGSIDYETKFTCKNGFRAKRVVGCHTHKSPLNLEYAIQTSCNSYFCNTLLTYITNPNYVNTAEGLDTWAKSIKELGFGIKLGTDAATEGNGYIPTSSLYDKYYGKNRWNVYSFISISIGQGEVVSTPLQLANFGAIIANRGYYYTPHLIKSINNYDNINEEYQIKQTTNIDKEHYEMVLNSMWKGVHESGTSTITKVKGLDICGKTGTVENQFGEDHSTFLGIAPQNNPEIVINVYVENGGYGAALAAPIASLMIEKYLTGEVKREWLVNHVLNKEIEYPHYDVK